MFASGVRQVRMAMGMALGRRLSTRNLGRLLDDALATIAEFGEPGADAGAVVDGPLTDAAARRDFATRGMRRTARRLAVRSPFYARRLEAAGVDAGRLTLDDLGKIPVTLKRDLVERSGEFHCTDAPRFLATRTTGTTGRPAEIWMSRYEMELWPALGAIARVLRGTMLPEDTVQINVSSRATGSVHLNVATCRLIGAGCRVLGMVPPDESLDDLANYGATQLVTVPSYLAELEQAARRRGLGPQDFRLTTIDVGGEVLSPSLVEAVSETFGVPTVNNLYAMTEIVPLVGRTCAEGHLHFDLNTGHVEYLDVDTGEVAEPGALATVVVTPYYPYRECMPVFRYDTRDMVRTLSGDLTCDLAGLPASSHIEGKADQLVRLGPGRVVTPRELVDAVEALPTRPWPARFRATVHDGRMRLTVPKSTVGGLDETDLVTHFAERGLEPEFAFVSDEEAVALRPVRSDLHETSFVARPDAIGA